MTGEMASIDKQGRDSNGDEWPTHAYLARKLRGELRPFDKYAGPYVKVPEGRLFLACDGAIDPMIVLWPGGIAPAYCEPVVLYYGPDDENGALSAARKLLRQYRKQRKLAQSE